LLQRLPELTWSATPTAVPFAPGLVASGDLEFVNFQSFGTPNQGIRNRLVDDRFYDTGADAVPNGQERNAAGMEVAGDAHNDDSISEGNGIFDEGEPLADSGQRVVVHPRLSYPMRVADLIEVNPEIGWYGTFYDTDNFGTEARNLLTGRLDLRSRARGELQLPFEMGAATHLIEPHASWIIVRGDDGETNPLLVPNTAVPQDRLRQLAVDNQLLDPSDRVEELSSLVFGVRNRLLRRRVGAIIADVDVSSEYRFEESEFGPAVLQGEARLPRGFWMRFLSSVDVEALEFAEGLALVGWSHPYGHQAHLRYRYIRDIPRFFEAFGANADRFDDFSDDFLRVNQIGGLARVQLTKQWAATFAGNFSFENALSLSNQFGVEYLSRCKCWAIRFEVDNDRVRGFSWGFNYRILGLGDDRERPFQGQMGRRIGTPGGL
jgi:lipopolysaccharide assembly outer membrane protein LptD (OstA)